jgi:hypothetical protein
MLRHLAVALPREFNAKKNRIRCQGHVINLAAQAFAHPKQADIDDPKNDADLNWDEDIMRALNEWQKNGAMAILLRIVDKIHRTPSFYEAFKKLTAGLTIPRDNDTRWNSSWKTLSRALFLRDLLDQFIEIHEFEDNEKLSQDEWVILEKVKYVTYPL